MFFLVLGCWEVGTWDPGMLGVLAAPAAREPTEPSCHLRLTKQREEREVNTATWVSLYLPQSINTSQGIALVNKNKTKKKKEMKSKNIPFIITTSSSLLNWSAIKFLLRTCITISICFIIDLLRLSASVQIKCSFWNELWILINLGNGKFKFHHVELYKPSTLLFIYKSISVLKWKSSRLYKLFH